MRLQNFKRIANTPELLLFILVSVQVGALTIGSSAAAYIPHSQSILGRLVRGHGKGAYVIEQDVQFRTGGEPLVLRERWLVENGDRLRLTVTASGLQSSGSGSVNGKAIEPVRLEFLYRDGRRYGADPTGGGAGKSSPVSGEFIEGVFHDRSSKSFLASLLRARIVPQSFSRDRTRPSKVEPLRHTPEPLVRLGRSAGVISWIMGEPSPIQGKANPAVWIEQDSFILRRLRFPSEAEVVAERISIYPNGLKFPRERTVTWENNSATIRVVSIKPTASASIAKQLEPTAFTNNANSNRPVSLPDSAQVREFYSRFR